VNEKGMLALWIFVTSATLGMLLEKQASARVWEIFRLILTIMGIIYLMFI